VVPPKDWELRNHPPAAAIAAAPGVVPGGSGTLEPPKPAGAPNWQWATAPGTAYFNPCPASHAASSQAGGF